MTICTPHGYNKPGKHQWTKYTYGAWTGELLRTCMKCGAFEYKDDIGAK